MSSDTQIAAYMAAKDKTTYWRNKLKKVLTHFPEGLTTEQACVWVMLGYADIPPLDMKINDIYKSLQPRTSEAHADCQIYDSGKRGFNASGKKAIIWKLVTTPEEREIAIKQNIKKMKPIGDKKLFGDMMRAIYAYANQQNEINNFDLRRFSFEWAENFAGKVWAIKNAEDVEKRNRVWVSIKKQNQKG